MWHVGRTWRRRHRVGRLSPPGPLCGAFFLVGLRLVTLILGTLGVMASLGAVACERTPPEDVASRPSPLAPAVSAQAQPRGGGAAPMPAGPTMDAALSGRCILPTPAAAPQAVPAGPAPGCPPDPEGPSKPTLGVRVTFPEAPDVAVDAELVRSQRDTMRGLMYRTSLADDHGMLFDLRVRDDHKFWMHNTCIPLDLLYVDEDGLIVGIVENAPTLNDEARGVGCPSLYVLEVNAGWARRHGIRAGQRMNIAGGGTQR
jgi:uncharacterized membrane protein (UPF0127 family)